MTTHQLYAIQDIYGGQVLQLAVADAPIRALDAHCDRHGLARYSDTYGLVDGPSMYITASGHLGAVFTNYEIVAVPVQLPLRIVGPGQNGYAVMDANELALVDGAESPADAVAQLLEVRMDGDELERLAMVEAADGLLAGFPGYAGSVPEGRQFVADLLPEPALADMTKVASLLVDQLVAAQGKVVDLNDADADQARAYDIASADVVLTLTRDEAVAIADALELLQGIDEGENTDSDELRRLAQLVRAEVLA